MTYLTRSPQVRATAKDRKYIIQNGLNPTTNYVATNIETMEQVAFDGLVIKAQYSDPFLGTVDFQEHVCAPYSIPYTALATPLSEMVGCSFRRFKHNFFRINSADPGTVWLFDKIQTNAYLHNIRIAARFAKAAGFVGLWIDNEAYNSSIFWKYSSLPQAYTFAQYQQRYKEVAREAMRLIQVEFPGLEVVLLISYEQLDGVATASLPSNTYGLLPSFLDGLYDAAEPPVTITNYQEQGYANQLQSWFDADFAIQLSANAPHLNSANYDHVNCIGMSTWPDTPGTGMDYVDDTQNYDSAAQFALNLGKALAGVTKYVFVYNQEHFKWWAGTAGVDAVPTVYRTALASARATANIEVVWGYNQIQDVKLALDTSSLSALANADPVSTYADTSGNSSNATQSGGNRPVYNTTAFGAGKPGVDFTVASSHYMVANGAAATFTGTSVPFTIICVGDATTGAPAASQRFLGIGKAGTANPDISFGQSSASKKWVVTRTGDSGTAAQASTDTLADAGSVITAPFIYVARSSGTVVQIYVNGVLMVIGAANTFAQSCGLTTHDQLFIGARAQNTVGSYWGGSLGDLVLVKRFMGLDEIRYVSRYMAIKFGVSAFA